MEWNLGRLNGRSGPIVARLGSHTSQTVKQILLLADGVHIVQSDTVAVNDQSVVQLPQLVATRLESTTQNIAQLDIQRFVINEDAFNFVQVDDCFGLNVHEHVQFRLGGKQTEQDEQHAVFIAERVHFGGQYRIGYDTVR